MYSKEQITFLMESGFSLDEIMQMNNPQPQQDPAPAPQPQQDPAPAPQPQPDPVPAPQPDGTAQILQGLAALTQAIQMQNINGVGFGAPPEQRSVDTVLGEIINPPRK